MDVKNAIQARRAYRSLETAKIEDSLLKELAQAISLAPSCFNKQPWRYVFVYEAGVLEQLKGALLKGNEWANNASMIIAVCSKSDMDCIMKDGREYYLFDTGIATAFMILRATELGFVAHPIAGYEPQKVREALGIPQDMQVAALVIFSKHSEIIQPVLNEHQAEAEKTRPERLPLNDIIFLNKYKAIQ